MYKRMYLHLFNRVTDALAALEAGDPARAGELLIAAQRECEERYLAGRKDDPKDARQSGGKTKT
jgi:galactokinase